MSPNPPEMTYHLLDVKTPVVPPIPADSRPGAARIRSEMADAARRAFKGMPWRGSNQPPQYHR